MIQDWALLGVVLGMLAIATLAGRWLQRQHTFAVDRRVVAAFNARIQAWWFFCLVVGMAFFSHELTVTLFGLLSFWALREFITLTPSGMGDHRALFWVFFFFTPMQFILVALDNYGLFSIMIPVYAFLFIQARAALSGQFERFLERVAKIQCALMVCVYCLSYAPALLYLQFKHTNDKHASARLLFFFMTVVLFSELLQFVWSKLYGKHPIAESITTARTWEGVLGGAVTSAMLGSILSWATPFQHWWHAAAMSLLIAVMASAGAITMAAIKRDRGEVRSGTLVEGHGGVLDRIDAVCFAAPVFYHVTRLIAV
jgi:phosphatidate cytidylyltransferase